MKKYLPVTVIMLGLFITLLVYNYKVAQPVKKVVRYLPIMGEKSLSVKDTVYHTIANFSFTNQLGKIITQNDVKGKDFVVEFFFTTCQSICPIMNTNMMKVAQTFETDSTFKILSHTVKPEEDSIAALKVYADAHKANHNNWFFLTGTKPELYKMARKSYLMNSEDGSGDEEDFIHTQLFALVDKQLRIRGYYDGTVDSEVQKLISDIVLLKKEEAENEFNSSNQTD